MNTIINRRRVVVAFISSTVDACFCICRCNLDFRLLVTKAVRNYRDRIISQKSESEL